MKKLLIIALCALSYHFTIAQNFEGIIIFKITYENLPPEMQNQEAMLPKEYKVHIKDKKSRVESSTAMSTTVVISDMDAKTSTILMNSMGQKMKISLDADDLDGIKSENKSDIEYINEEKTIAGYTCKKALLKTEGDNEGSETSFYYTEEIAPIKLHGFEGMMLKGMPLEYSVSSQGIKMVMTASKIEKTSVSDSMFDVPEGYMEMPENMKQSMGQQY